MSKPHTITKDDVKKWRASFQHIASSHGCDGRPSKRIEGSARGEYKITIDGRIVCQT